MLPDELKNINSSKKELKKFALTIGIVLLIISGVMFYFAGGLKFHFAAAGILLIGIGCAFPEVLLPLHKAWMGLALALGFISTRVILIILFYFVVTPIKIIALITGKKFLELSFDKTKKSYWNYRNKKEYWKSDSERQF